MNSWKMPVACALSALFGSSLMVMLGAQQPEPQPRGSLDASERKTFETIQKMQEREQSAAWDAIATNRLTMAAAPENGFVVLVTKNGKAFRILSQGPAMEIEHLVSIQDTGVVFPSTDFQYGFVDLADLYLKSTVLEKVKGKSRNPGEAAP
jgi:hypothetical protein